MSNKIRIVVIEDHKLLRVGLRGMIDNCDDIIVVSEAESGKEGIEKVKMQRPDVVLLDLGLPDISGLEVIKQINEQSPSSKIIVLTSHNNNNEAQEALRAGIYAYVLKDIKDEMLLMIIRSVHLGAMWLDPQIVEFLRKNPTGVLPQRNYTRAGFKAQHANLTEREYEVLKLVVDGKSNLQIAQILSISEHTSKAHVCNIIQKLVVDDRTQAAVKALKEGLV